LLVLLDQLNKMLNFIQ